MPPGPTLIFDKSTLQSLNPDEAMWLDNFFICAITPLFYVEVLADLEKEVRKGRTPEEVVGSLAAKTPDMESVAHVHHRTLLAMELSGTDEIDMRFGRPLVPGGKPVALEGQSGVIFQQSSEAEALQRWQRHEFLDVERLMAKNWRRMLSGIDLENAYQVFGNLLTWSGKPRTLVETKAIADWIIDQPDQGHALLSGLSVVGYSRDTAEAILSRWDKDGRRPVRQFAPYFAHVLGVELVFFIGIASDLISRDRPSNMIDVAYLHYLPFCSAFASSDKLHARLAPLFLLPHQRFVDGTTLKRDLSRIDNHFAALPEEVRARGVSTFANYPPDDDSNIVTQLWNTNLPTWREHKATREARERDDSGDAALIAKFNRMADAPAREDGVFMHLEEADYVMIQRFVMPKRGKWLRFPPEALKRKAESGE
jgi:hypothetical protein